MTPAIVLSAHNIGLAVTRALGRMGVTVFVAHYDARDMAQVSRYVKDKIVTPHPGEHESEFVAMLVDNACRFGHGVLFPADDVTLSAVTRNMEILGAHYIVAAVEGAVAERFLVKKHTYALAESIGVAVPRTKVPRSMEDLAVLQDEFAYPCLVKPCESHRYFERFGRKMVVARNPREMTKAFEEAVGAGLEVMIQELIPGPESNGANYNSYFWEDEPLAEFTAEKVRMSPPGFGVPRVVVSKRIPEVIDPGRRILRAMGFRGYSCTEFKRDDRDGEYKLLEINGRHNRSAPLAIACGVNFPWIEYRNLCGQRAGFAAAEEGVYWIDEFRDVAGSLRYAAAERYSLREYVRPYLGRHVFATASADDWRPFARRCATLTGSVLRRMVRKRVARSAAGAPRDGAPVGH